MRDYCGTPVDPASSRGTLSAQVTLGLPLKEDLPAESTNYTIAVELTNFAAERMMQACAEVMDPLTFQAYRLRLKFLTMVAARAAILQKCTKHFHVLL